MRIAKIMPLFAGVLSVVAIAAAWAVEPADNEPAALSSADQKLLDGLLKQFLFDPQGARYVCVKTTCRTVWASSVEIPREGWLVEKQSGKAARICFADGESISSPGQHRIENLDFVDQCRKRFAEAPKPARPGTDDRAVFDRMEQTALGQTEQSDLVLAAWLYRLGHLKLAAKALVNARQKFDAANDVHAPPERSGDVGMVLRLREDLAWGAFAGMVHAYMVRADEEALIHGRRLVRLYPGIASREYAQASDILGELERRKAKGTFGKTPSEKWPNGFQSWGQEKKIAWLIDSLDEVDARQWGQPGGISLAEDRRVAALIDIGDPAVPTLIDAVEKDYAG